MISKLTPTLARALLTTSLLLSVHGPAGAAQAKSPRVERIEGLVEAFNSGDPQTLLSFLEANATSAWYASRPAESRIKLFTQVMRDLGTLEIRGIDFDGVSKVTTSLASDTNPDNVRFLLTFQQEPPYLVTELGIDITAGLPEGADNVPSMAELGELKFLDALDAYLQEMTDNDEFAGTVLIARNGRPVFKGAYGLANRSWNVANDMSTRFNLGSINKQFTKIAIGQLMAAGKVKLDDTILDHLPAYPNSGTAQRITIQHLLDHSAGLGDIFGPEFSAGNKSRWRVNEDFFELFAHRPLEFEPGSQRSYSNAGYIVLGAIVGAASDMPYTDYVRENIFEPAGMIGAEFAANDDIHANVAMGYTTRTGTHGEEGPLRPNILRVPVVGMGAGGAVATAADLFAFDRAVREHRLLDPRYTAWLFEGSLADEAVGTGPVQTPIGIAGGAPGVNALLESDGTHTIVFLTNIDPPSASGTGMAVARQFREGAAEE